MNRTIAVALITASLGFMAGRFLPGAPHGADPPKASSAPQAVAKEVATSPLRPNPTPPPSRRAMPCPEPERPKPSDEVACERRAQALQTALSDAREKLDRLEKDPERRSLGARIAFPPGVTATSEQVRLQGVLTEELGRLNTPSTIDGVDCTEFPCLVHGELELDGGDDPALRKLFDALQNRFPDQNVYASQSTFRDPKGEQPTTQRFSISMYPKDLEAEKKSSMEKRLRYRKNEYFDASRP